MKFLLLALLPFYLSAQSPPDRSNWKDTTMIRIDLHPGPSSKKVLVYDYGKNAMLFFALDDVEAICDHRSRQSWGKNYKVLMDHLNKKFRKKDTVSTAEYDPELDAIADTLLLIGKVNVYDKVNHEFPTLIYQRLEKYGEQAHRFFYFEDRRPFFEELELIGILEEGDPLQNMGKHAEEYGKLYDKLRQVGK